MLKVYAYITQEVARRADEKRESKKNPHHLVTQPTCGNRLLTPATCTSDFGNAPLLYGRGTKNTEEH